MPTLHITIFGTDDTILHFIIQYIMLKFFVGQESGALLLSVCLVHCMAQDEFVKGLNIPPSTHPSIQELFN